MKVFLSCVMLGCLGVSVGLSMSSWVDVDVDVRDYVL